MKPDWKDAPSWAQWLAMDDGGTWFWYELEPTYYGRSWRPPGGKGKLTLASELPDIDASETHEARPS